jgi:CelD/BcsL family acetyltransferase involved in cellulose biosynthesis
MKEYRTEVIRSMDQFKAISKPWNELLNKSSSNNIFLTWEWQFSWAESFLKEGRQLFIVAVYHEDELVGIAPWYVRRDSMKGIPIKQIEFLGTPEGGCDYLDVLARKGKEEPVTTALYEFLFNEVSPQWDCMRLVDIRANSMFLLHLLSRIAEEGKYLEITTGSFCPFAALPRTREELYANLSTNRREQFRRHLKMLNGSGNMEHRSVSSIGVLEVLDEYFAFYENEKQLFDTSLRSLIKNFLSRCDSGNRVQIDLLRSQGKNIAGLLHLCYEGVISMYLMAVDKDYNPKISVGNVLVGLSVENAVSQGFSVYDFLKGTEPYKFHWANGVNTSLEIFLAQNKIAPVLLSLGKLAKNGAKLLLR